MAQSPLPTPPDSIRVPLPDSFERWRDFYLHDASQKLIVFLILALLLYVLTRIARGLIAENIQEVNRRHSLKKWINYAFAFLLVFTGIALFADRLVGFGTVIAVLVAGVAIALQDVLKSVVGWFYISSRSGIDMGSRIEVGGVIGDVIDIGVLKTTVLEVGNLVYGRQSTGRLVSIPNSSLLSEGVHFSGNANPFVWQEVKVTVTFESDWKRAEEILRGVGDGIYAEIAEELERGFGGMERKYAFKYGKRTPIVYVSLGEAGVDLVLRFLIHVRRRRGAVDQVSRKLLEAFAAEPRVRFAYPTYRMFRFGDESPGPGGSFSGAGE
jgi:small-conductance mechanosensitive channel